MPISCRYLKWDISTECLFKGSFCLGTWWAGRQGPDAPHPCSHVRKGCSTTTMNLNVEDTKFQSGRTMTTVRAYSTMPLACCGRLSISASGRGQISPKQNKTPVRCFGPPLSQTPPTSWSSIQLVLGKEKFFFFFFRFPVRSTGLGPREIFFAASASFSASPLDPG